jgi:hypothetical protein
MVASRGRVGGCYSRQQALSAPNERCGYRYLSPCMLGDSTEGSEASKVTRFPSSIRYLELYNASHAIFSLLLTTNVSLSAQVLGNYKL